MRVLHRLRYLCAEPELPKAVATVAKTPNILIVEDDRDIADSLVAVLVIKGYGVRKVTSRDDALFALQSQVYECILMDLRMPGMSIEEFMRRKPAFPHSKIILTTTEANIDVTQFDSFLPKPFTPDQVVSVINQVLTKH